MSMRQSSISPFSFRSRALGKEMSLMAAYCWKASHCTRTHKHAHTHTHTRKSKYLWVKEAAVAGYISECFAGTRLMPPLNFNATTLSISASHFSILCFELSTMLSSTNSFTRALKKMCIFIFGSLAIEQPLAQPTAHWILSWRIQNVFWLRNALAFMKVLCNFYPGSVLRSVFFCAVFYYSNSLN